MLDVEKKNYKDLNLLRYNLIGSFLKKSNPASLFSSIKNFPFLIHKRKFECLTKSEEDQLLEAEISYKSILQSMLSVCLFNMYENRSTLDLRPMFQFIFGGDIFSDNRFFDHETNKIYCSFLNMLYLPGMGYTALSSYSKSTKEEILAANNFCDIDITSCEEKYKIDKTFPGHLYILLAFTYNYQIVSGNIPTSYDSKEDPDNKYNIFIDYYGYSSKIYTLRLDKESVYADIFFKLCLDEKIKKFNQRISSITEAEFLKKPPKVILYDPSERISKKN